MSRVILSCFTLLTLTTGLARPDTASVTTEAMVDLVRNEARARCQLVPGSIDFGTSTGAPAGPTEDSGRPVTFSCAGPRGVVRAAGVVDQAGYHAVADAEVAPAPRITTEQMVTFARQKLFLVADHCTPEPGSIQLEDAVNPLEIYTLTPVRFRCIRDGRAFNGRATLRNDGRGHLDWLVELKHPTTRGDDGAVPPPPPRR